MSLDSIITVLIVPIIFIWLGALIYSHEEEHLKPILAKIKGWFIKDEDSSEVDVSTGDFEIGYSGAQY